MSSTPDDLIVEGIDAELEVAGVDLYSEILGIPVGERPPHYYELLGVELFCSHYERIDQSVRKLFRFIKPFHDHPDRDTREAIQDMMTHIATARVVLTDPDRKEAYDLSLAAILGIDRDAYLASQVAAPIPEYQLVVVSGPSNVEARVELVEGAVASIGASRSCTMSLSASGRVADRHVVVGFEDGDWVLRRSETGRVLQVNDTICSEFVLREGDRIDIGGYRLLFTRVVRNGVHGGGGASQGTGSNGTASNGIGVVRVAPPLSLIIQRGPTVAAPIFNALAPQRFLIGQSETALWRLPDPAVDRHYCAIQTVGGDWEVEGLGEDGIVVVNGCEVMRHLFRDRDVLTVGPFDVLVSLRA